jgi:hypothetical protein
VSPGESTACEPWSEITPEHNPTIVFRFIIITVMLVLHPPFNSRIYHQANLRIAVEHPMTAQWILLEYSLWQWNTGHQHLLRSLADTTHVSISFDEFGLLYHSCLQPDRYKGDHLIIATKLRNPPSRAPLPTLRTTRKHRIFEQELIFVNKLVTLVMQWDILACFPLPSLYFCGGQSYFL